MQANGGADLTVVLRRSMSNPLRPAVVRQDAAMSRMPESEPLGYDVPVVA